MPAADYTPWHQLTWRDASFKGADGKKVPTKRALIAAFVWDGWHTLWLYQYPKNYVFTHQRDGVYLQSDKIAHVVLSEEIYQREVLEMMVKIWTGVDAQLTEQTQGKTITESYTTDYPPLDKADVQG